MPSIARQRLQSQQLAQESIDGQTYWLPRALPGIRPSLAWLHFLPGFDEYLRSYQR